MPSNINIQGIWKSRIGHRSGTCIVLSPAVTPAGDCISSPHSAFDGRGNLFAPPPANAAHELFEGSWVVIRGYNYDRSTFNITERTYPPTTDHSNAHIYPYHV